MSACLVRWREVPDGARVETYEDVADDPAAVLAVGAFEAERSTRCKLCTGALGVTAVSLARAGKQGDPESIATALEGATCVCTGRGSLRRALLPRA
jgi:aerobic-type carbon monoxide dehydrogenase small subunit (CoxS/CutS family)